MIDASTPAETAPSSIDTLTDDQHDRLNIPDFLRRTDTPARKARPVSADKIKLRRSRKKQRQKRKRPGDPAALAHLGYRPSEIARIGRVEADRLITFATPAGEWRHRPKT